MWKLIVLERGIQSKKDLGKIIKVKDKLPLVVLSHLDRASQASDDDFGIDLSMLEVADFDKVQKK